MRYQRNGDARLATGHSLFVLRAAAVLALLSGCGGAVDQKFAPESYDEYTEPLTNAIVGSPSGVVVIGGTGSSSGVGTGVATGISVGSGIGVGGGTGGGTGTATATGIGGSSSSGGGSSGSSSGGAFDAGPGEGGVDGGAGGGFGFWHFDDCSPTSNFLADSSGEGANAQHALRAACVPGISGLGVQVRSAKDVIQVPDEPQFTVGSRVAVAAWVHPNTVTGDQPIVIKRLNNQTSFSLGIHNGNIEMSVVLKTGTTVISRAPIAAGTWTHVAGMYDGTFVFLFINGQPFGQIYAAGTLRNVFAPIRIGATTQTQHFNGIIDEVFVSTQDISKDTLAALACISNPSTFTVNPAVGAAPFDTSVHYDVAVSNNDIGFCQAKPYEFFFQFFNQDPTISAVVDSPGFFPSVLPGTTVTFGAEVTGTDAADPGLHLIPFNVDVFQGPPNFGVEQLFGNLTLNLTAPTGCFVFTRRELMITNVSVVDDPVRTFGVFTPGFSFPDGGASFDAGFGSSSGGSVGGGSSSGISFGGSSGGGGPVPIPRPPAFAAATADAQANSPSQGVWTFGHLMRELAPTPEQAPAMTLALFQHWLTDQTVNGFTVSARPAMQQVLLDVWPKTPTGDLDLDQPPLTLQAIVNRIDIRNLANGSAGEGRFVFAVNGEGFPQSFTVILEYNLPATTMQDVQDWANLWHGLSSHPFPSEEYNAALEAVTRRFTGRNAAPGAPNGSALLELRTNEIALSFEWELRAFALSPTTGFFDEIPVAETPDLGFNGTQTFSDFVNQNAAAIIAELPGANDHTVPLTFEGQNFLAGSVFNNQIEWSGPGIANPDARFHASTNTCNGCHGPDTGTFNFTMITPRFAGTEAQLSPFLTGTTAFDDFTGQTRTLNDLGRRRTDLTSLVCASDGGSPPPPPPPADAGSVPTDASLASP